MERASDFALRRMKNQSVAALVLARARMGQSLDVADYRRELESVSAEDIQAAFQYCLRANPTLSIVGDEPAVRAAFKDGW